MNDLVYTFLLITMIGMIVVIFASIIKIIIGPTIWDRILMVNLISVKILLFVVIYAVYIDNKVLLDISISYGIIGYLTITLLTKYIMSGGRVR